jgi:hypothetical protein
MIIYDSDIVGMIAFPSKDNAPLDIDAEAPEAAELARQLLEAIAWWNAEKCEGGSSVDLVQQPLGFCMQGGGEPARVARYCTVIDVPSYFVSKAFYHDIYIIYRYISQ